MFTCFLSHAVRMRAVFGRWTAAYNGAIVARLRTTQADIHYHNLLTRRSLTAWLLLYRMETTKRVHFLVLMLSYSSLLTVVHRTSVGCTAHSRARSADLPDVAARLYLEPVARPI